MATKNGTKGVFIYCGAAGQPIHVWNSRRRAADHFARMCDRFWILGTAEEIEFEAVYEKLPLGLTGEYKGPNDSIQRRTVKFHRILDEN